MDKSREQFERLAAKEGLSLEVFNGDYNWMNTRLAWKFWQASRESLEVELPCKYEQDDEYDYFTMGYNAAIETMEEFLVSDGVKVK